jgi:glycosyltransferase involved in cell wall biosynthesis
MGAQPTLLAVNNYYYARGGAEIAFFTHNALFEALGWRVVPFAMQHGNNLDTPWSKYFVTEIEHGEKYSALGKAARAAKVIYSLEARRKLGRLIDEVRPDLCHLHNIYHHISPSILGLMHARGIPSVMTLHDLKIACPAYNMLAPDGICERCKGGRLHHVLLNRCIKGSATLSAVVLLESTLHRLLGSFAKHVNAFVVPSRFYVDKLAEWGMPAQLFHHVPNFIAAERFAPRFEPGRAFVYFGRVSPEKGITTLIRAAAAAGQALRIVGTGPQLDKCRALAAELGADVTFVGYLTGEALHIEVRNARAVVLPSEWYENAPLSVLEAYALGKPVIGARIGGIPELVREGETGLTFTSGNVQSLAAALEALGRAPDDDVATLGRTARDWVEREFSAARYRARMLEVYRGVGLPAAKESAAHWAKER